MTSEVCTIGLDLAKNAFPKNAFQVPGAAAAGAVVFRKQLRRGQVLKFFADQPRCLVAMEACGSSHFWAREIGRLGHEVRMIPPAYVKPFVKRQKNDAAVAEAICEAAQRPTMRLVPVKSQVMKRFKSARHLNRFVSIHDGVANLHNFPGHAMSSSDDPRFVPRRWSPGARSPNWASLRSASGRRPVFARPTFGKLTVPAHEAFCLPERQTHHCAKHQGRLDGQVGEPPLTARVGPAGSAPTRDRIL
jgi:hypothetical protein